MGVNGIYGLSGSGLDIESMVKVGMMSKQNEYDKMAQKFTKNEWTKAAYLELNSSITTFNASTLSQYKMSANMNAKTASSNSSDVKVEANATAPIMSHQVEVESLSAAAYLVSTARDSSGNIIPDKGITRYQGASSSNAELKNMLFQTLTYDETAETVTKVSTGPNPLSRTSSIKTGGYSYSNLSYSDKAISFYLNDGTSTENGGKGVEISFTFKEIIDGATLNDLASRINGKGINVRAAYDTVNDKFSLYNVKGGEANTIKLTGGSAGAAGYSGLVFLNALNLTQVKNGEIVTYVDATDEDNPVTKDRIISITSLSDSSKNNDGITGENGKIIVDGIEYATTDNKATVGGITYTALAKTSKAATVSVSQDVDSIVDKVKSFVTDYNKLLSTLYEKYDEKPETGYTPLTQSQKDAMKEEQVEKWEAKAKKGLLYHDQTLGKIISEMRESIYTTVDGVEGKYNSAFSIGISTTGLKGQLVLDEDKLRKALAEDSDSVYNVFAKLDDGERVAVKKADGTPLLDENGKQVYNTVERPSYNGIAQRLGDIFQTAMKNIKSRAGSSADITEDSDLNTLLRNLQTKMSNFKKMMNSFEDALYKKYDKMETTLASLGAQLNFVMGGNQ